MTIKSRIFLEFFLVFRNNAAAAVVIELLISQLSGIQKLDGKIVSKKEISDFV